jgi:hypothetical protein
MITDQEISNSIAECETVAIDLDETHFDLDFSGFFSMAEDQKHKTRIKKIMEGMRK